MIPMDLGNIRQYGAGSLTHLRGLPSSGSDDAYRRGGEGAKPTEFGTRGESLFSASLRRARWRGGPIIGIGHTNTTEPERCRHALLAARVVTDQTPSPAILHAPRIGIGGLSGYGPGFGREQRGDEKGQTNRPSHRCLPLAPDVILVQAV